MSDKLDSSNLEKEQVMKNQDLEQEAIQKRKPIKPPKIEDKPFDEFVNEYLLPGIKKELKLRDIEISTLKLNNEERPVTGGKCWLVSCEFKNRRKFYLSFEKQDIKSPKTISLVEGGQTPALLESFLIDEKKITLSLLISRLLQRLNGQKWLTAN